MNKDQLIKEIKNLTEPGNENWNHQYFFSNGVKTRDKDVDSLGYNIPKWGRLEPIIQELIKTNRTFLDIGCSDGYFCNCIASMNAERVIGIDLDQIRIRRSLFIKDLLNLTNVEFRVQDLYEIAKKERFDVVLGLGLLHRVPDINECISKSCEVANNFVIFEFKTTIGKKDEIVHHDEETKSNSLNKLHGTPTISYVTNRLKENNFETTQVLEDTTGNLRYPRTIIVGKRDNSGKKRDVR